MLEYERDLQASGSILIAGMDEAGRGPLAGPVFAAMVIIPLDNIIEGVNDSKKLTPKKRSELSKVIKEKSLAFSICSVDESEIDRVNILEADKECMNKCCQEISIKPDYCLVDFVPHLELPFPHKEIVKGDAKSYSIACASILAKVARDEYMEEMAIKYPQYQFDKHKGYGTKLHYEMLRKYGPCEIHRKSFLKKFYEKESI